MKIADANIYLRYLLNDIPDQYERSKTIIENEQLHMPVEVLCEIVYVLAKVYKVSRDELSQVLSDLVQQNNIDLPVKNVVMRAINVFKDTRLDFVDCLLIGYAKINAYDIITFDEKLLNRIRIEESD